MILTVLYPHHDGAKFDADYYVATHARLAEDIWHPKAVTLVTGSDGPDGSKAPFAMIAQFDFGSAEAFGKAMADPRLGELQADVPKFTDITPQMVIGQKVG